MSDYLEIKGLTVDSIDYSIDKQGEVLLSMDLGTADFSAIVSLNKEEVKKLAEFLLKQLDEEQTTNPI